MCDGQAAQVDSFFSCAAMLIGINPLAVLLVCNACIHVTSRIGSDSGSMAAAACTHLCGGK